MGEKNWYKGSLHTHTTESDGDAEPEAVVRWFREHDYDFLALTDHNHLTVVDCGPGEGRPQGPLMIAGEEVSALARHGTAPIHVNGIGITKEVDPISDDDVVAAIQANVDAILQAGGIACINHPNFKWAFDHEAIARITGASLLEIYNGHPAVNNHGVPGKLSCEEIWDAVLSSGQVIFGVAADDSHHYHDFSHTRANPGRGWVVVRASELSGEAVTQALASGEFYASTGVALAELEQSRQSIHLKIERVRDNMYVTTFTGRGGVTLAEQVGLEATYRLRGDEGYVRATVFSTSGHKAWAQPVFVR